MKTFEERLRLFGVRVGIICSLEHGGKLTEEESFQGIKKLWKKLKKHKKGPDIEEQTEATDCEGDISPT